MNIVINGNLTKDPEIKYFESGKIKSKGYTNREELFEALNK